MLPRESGLICRGAQESNCAPRFYLYRHIVFVESFRFKIVHDVVCLHLIATDDSEFEIETPHQVDDIVQCGET